jgi:hypothetical protein
MTFNKANLRTIRADLEKAIGDVLAKHGAVGSLGGIRFTDREFGTRLTVSIPTESAASAAGTESFYDLPALQKVARLNALPQDLVNKKFTVNGTVFTLTDVKGSRPKYPFIGMGPRGGRYKFTVKQVATGLL